MDAFWLHKAGDGTVLERRMVAVPVPADGEMLVQVKAASLNRGDLMGRIHRHRVDQPRPAGVDGAGIVVEPGGSSFRPGDRVMFLGHGCFAEFATVNPELATDIPETMSFEQAAAVPGAFITAWSGLVQCGRASESDWVLLCGATSGVGVAALQIAKLLGAKVIATSGSAAKLSTLKALAADEVVLSRGSAFVEDVLRVTQGKGVDVSLNMVGATAFPGCIQVAADFGRVVLVGYVDGQLRAECDLEAVHGRRLVVTGTSNAPLTPAQRAEAQRGFMRDVFPALASGAIVPVIDRVFPFDELPAAKAHFDSHQQIGKVIVSLASVDPSTHE
jgi:NADPH2:quinone reductase